MCKFFSLISDGKGKPYYFNAKQRDEIKGLPYATDSHTSIADFYGFRGALEDKMNKYEYNPLTKQFSVDRLNTEDDSKKIKKFCENLDFRDIEPLLIVKPIIHPFKDRNRKRVTKEDLILLRGWNSVGDSVWNSVWNSVRNSVGDSVRDSVGDSVWNSVWDSVGDSVGGYFCSFFLIKYKFDFTIVTKLWENGLVPSFDGKIWRLHSANGVLWSGEIK